jgi:hypothetical protein
MELDSILKLMWLPIKLEQAATAASSEHGPLIFVVCLGLPRQDVKNSRVGELVGGRSSGS